MDSCMITNQYRFEIIVKLYTAYYVPHVLTYLILIKTYEVTQWPVWPYKSHDHLSYKWKGIMCNLYLAAWALWVLCYLVGTVGPFLVY